jgi:hypothetical protein
MDSGTEHFAPFAFADFVKHPLLPYLLTTHDYSSVCALRQACRHWWGFIPLPAVCLSRPERPNTLPLDSVLAKAVIIEIESVDQANTELKSSLVTSIRESSHLQTLRLKNIDIDSDFGRSLTESIMYCHTLTCISLYYVNIDAAAAEPFFVSLLKHSAISRLILPASSMDKNTSAQFCSALATNRTLRRLKFRDIDHGSTFCFHLAKALETNHFLQELDFIAVALSTQAANVALGLRLNQGLTRLDLSYTNCNDQAARVLGMVLERNRSLRQLVLYDNCIEDPTTIAQALKSNTTLEVLDISHNVLAGPGVLLLAEAIGLNSGLTDLNLSKNYLDTSFSSQFAESLRKNSTLTQLDLSRNFLRDAGIALLGQALVRNSTLTSLCLTYTGCNSEGCVGLASAVAANVSLKKLELQGNPMIGVHARHLVEALRHNSTMETLTISLTFCVAREAMSTPSAPYQAPDADYEDSQEHLLNLRDLLNRRAP